MSVADSPLSRRPWSASRAGSELLIGREATSAARSDSIWRHQAQGRPGRALGPSEPGAGAVRARPGGHPHYLAGEVSSTPRPGRSLCGRAVDLWIIGLTQSGGGP